MLLAALAQLPDAKADPLREELADWMQELIAAYEAGDAVKHYRLDRQLFFEFMMKLNFALQADQT